MRLYGIIGYPLGHSFSKDYFLKKFEKENIQDAGFETFEMKGLSDFRQLIMEKEYLSGISVTIPFKESILTHLDEVNPVAQKIGAVNSIKIYRDKGFVKTKGYNTDFYGFEKSIQPLLKQYHTKALILGSGGSSKAISYVFDQLGIEYLFVSRNPFDCKQVRYEILNEEMMMDFSIIVNCTPVGMYPNINEYPPIPYEHLTASHLLFDLTYNPDVTIFMKKGKVQRATVKNGLEMLQLQAEKSWELWNE